MAYISYLFYWLTRPFIKVNIVSDSDLSLDLTKPIKYVLVTNSFADKLALEQVCRKQSLPSPFKSFKLGGHSLSRAMGVKHRKSLFTSEKKHEAKIVKHSQELLVKVADSQRDVKFVPVMVCWGRAPGVEKAKENTKIGIKDLIAENLQASRFRKFFIVLSYDWNTICLSSRFIFFNYFCNDFIFNY